MTNGAPSDRHQATVTICNHKGLHARASAAFVQCAEKYRAEVKVTRDGETVDGDSIMDLLLLAAAKGASITISVTGPEAGKALHALTDLVEAGFYEEN